MCVEDRPRALQLNQERHQHEERAEKHQADGAAHQVHPPFERQFPTLEGDVADREQGQPAKVADRHLAGHYSKSIRQHANTDFFALTQADDADQFLMRIFRQGDNHFVDGEFVYDSGNVGDAAQNRHIENGTRTAVIYDTYYLKAQFWVGLHSLQNHAAGVAAADEQYPVSANAFGLSIPL